MGTETQFAFPMRELRCVRCFLVVLAYGCARDPYVCWNCARGVPR